MERKLKIGDIVKSERFPNSDKEYIVCFTCKDGGGTGHGPHDVYPDGHKAVMYEKDNPSKQFYIYQTGSFIKSIKILPKEIILIDHSETVLIDHNFDKSKILSLRKFLSNNAKKHISYTIEVKYCLPHQTSQYKNVCINDNKIKYIDKEKDGTIIKDERKIDSILKMIIDKKHKIRIKNAMNMNFTVNKHVKSEYENYRSVHANLNLKY
jgi:hypothetical protein